MLRRFLAAGTLACSAALISGCSLLNQQAAEPNPVQTKEVPAVVDEVVAALKPLEGRGDVPSTQEFFDTMTEAGYKPEQLEATIDASPLGNDVPAKMFGVKVDDGCVVGEIRSGNITAHLAKPTESTGTCLLGYVERPEGVDAPTGDERDEDSDDNGAGHMPGEDMNGEDPEEPSETGGSDEGTGDGGGEGSGEEEESTEAPQLGG
ncbi:DUF6993 domain-containing protein [Brevibacterium luteolum]|uniref:DUF6993 domain-containing protein n=1 Tax=Brevibacterium luteolum TaxID=199591 RepID=A0A2N6PK45_9MICO|nr:hypothetical protein [Brevibacterium luteolum]MCT1830782.1 hypothetical protein [Brevibacterium luteolum]MCT1922622.1 hypothetical protein [Brevibacterium luteolum]PMB99045.1 hypothetical protein CJ198_00385 [Brevibacterium luteolum]